MWRYFGRVECTVNCVESMFHVPLLIEESKCRILRESHVREPSPRTDRRLIDAACS